jgi:hypothetical protein
MVSIRSVDAPLVGLSGASAGVVDSCGWEVISRHMLA